MAIIESRYRIYDGEMWRRLFSDLWNILELECLLKKCFDNATNKCKNCWEMTTSTYLPCKQREQTKTRKCDTFWNVAQICLDPFSTPWYLKPLESSWFCSSPAQLRSSPLLNNFDIFLEIWRCSSVQNPPPFEQLMHFPGDLKMLNFPGDLKVLKCSNILHLRTLLPFGLGAILILTFTDRTGLSHHMCHQQCI